MVLAPTTHKGKLLMLLKNYKFACPSTVSCDLNKTITMLAKEAFVERIYKLVCDDKYTNIEWFEWNMPDQERQYDKLFTSNEDAIKYFNKYFPNYKGLDDYYTPNLVLARMFVSKIKDIIAANKAIRKAIKRDGLDAYNSIIASHKYKSFSKSHIHKLFKLDKETADMIVKEVKRFK